MDFRDFTYWNLAYHRQQELPGLTQSCAFYWKSLGRNFSSWAQASEQLLMQCHLHLSLVAVPSVLLLSIYNTSRIKETLPRRLMGRNFDLVLHLAPLCLPGAGGLGTDLWWRVHPGWQREPWHGKASKKQHCKESEVKPCPSSASFSWECKFSGRKGVQVVNSVHFFVCLCVFPPFPAAGSLLCSTEGCGENQFAFCGCLNKFKLPKP